MPHTRSRYMMDLAFNDGEVSAGVGDIVNVTSAGTSAITRTALGNYNYAISASTTTFFAVNVTNQVLRRLGFFEDLQEQFGGLGIAASADPQLSRPDAMGSMNKAQQITPRTAFKVKGFRLLDFDTIYTVTGAPFNTLTSSVYLTQFNNNVAVAPVAIVAAGVNGLTNLVQANPYVSTLALTTAQLQAINNPAGGPPGYLIQSDQQLWIEVAIVTGAGATGTFYGFDLGIEFNFN
jgi:hypothetical protein